MSNIGSHSIPKDEKAFERLFREHYAALVTFALKYTREEEAAEEIVQEMFTNVWAKADSIEVKTTLKSYLYGAVRNACLNHLKHEKVKQTHAEGERLLRVEASYTDVLELSELQGRVGQAMDRIPEKCRQVFELSRFEGKKYQEIADELGLSVKTVENQMGKALRILREHLKEYLTTLLIFFITHGGKF